MYLLYAPCRREPAPEKSPSYFNIHPRCKVWRIDERYWEDEIFDKVLVYRGDQFGQKVILYQETNLESHEFSIPRNFNEPIIVECWYKGQKREKFIDLSWQDSPDSINIYDFSFSWPNGEYLYSLGIGEDRILAVHGNQLSTIEVLINGDLYKNIPVVQDQMFLVMSETDNPRRGFYDVRLTSNIAGLEPYTFNYSLAPENGSVEVSVRGSNNTWKILSRPYEKNGNYLGDFGTTINNIINI